MRNVFRAFANLLVLLLLVILPESTFAYQSPEINTATPDSLSQNFGFIYFEVEPDTAFVYLNYDYQNVIKVTDGDSLKLPPENYNILIFAKDIPERRVNLEVAESEVDTVRVQNPRAKSVDDTYASYAAYSWDSNVMLFSDNETLISIDGFDNFTFGSLRANLPSGVYRVRFESLSGKEHEVFLEVNSYQLETYEIYFKPKERRHALPA